MAVAHAVAEPVVLRAGPATLCITTSRGTARPPAGRPALEVIDDPVTVVDGRPVAVTALLRGILGAALEHHRGPVTVVHPSWWPAGRVARIIDALAATAPVTTVMSCPDAVRRHFRRPAAAVVEIAPEHLALSGAGGSLRMLGRRDIAAALDALIPIAGGEAVLIDAPAEVPGASHTAEAIGEHLGHSGLRWRIVDIGESLGRQRCRRSTADPRRRMRAAMTTAGVAAGVAIVVAVLGAPAWPRAAPVAATPVARLIQAGVAVDIPPGWTVRRVSGGPGSRRVEVASSDDAAAVLHITSSYAPGTTLSQAAAVLGRAVAAEPAGVFMDFRASAVVAGRRALTYREIRPGRVVRWSVVLDGSTRIGIGCQSAPERQSAVGRACDQAVASAHELPGTAPRR